MNFRAWLEADDYRGTHTAPNSESGSPLYDLTAKETFPDDIYGPFATRFYGHGQPHVDSASIEIIQNAKGRPDMPIKIYRAIPADLGTQVQINVGDWVTINRAYAVQHGRRFGKYKILMKTVPAKTLFTNGDSIHEWGYYP